MFRTSFLGDEGIFSAANLIKNDFFMLIRTRQDVEESQVGAIFLVDEILRVKDTSLGTEILTLLGQLIDNKIAQILVSSVNPARLE